MPVNQAMNLTAMNRPIFIRATGTPTARALPPVAADEEVGAVLTASGTRRSRSR